MSRIFRVRIAAIKEKRRFEGARPDSGIFRILTRGRVPSPAPNESRFSLIFSGKRDFHFLFCQQIVNETKKRAISVTRNPPVNARVNYINTAQI